MCVCVSCVPEYMSYIQLYQYLAQSNSMGKHNNNTISYLHNTNLLYEHGVILNNTEYTHNMLYNYTYCTHKNIS